MSGVNTIPLSPVVVLGNIPHSSIEISTKSALKNATTSKEQKPVARNNPVFHEP
jgi:hypothetical protein